MKSLLIIMCLVISIKSKADVLEKLRFEDAVENRIERGLKGFDPNIKATVFVGYKKYDAVPGTTLENLEDFSPSKIDEQDIVKIYIDITTSVENVSAEFRSKVYKLLPLNRNRLIVKFKYQPEVKAPVIETIKAKDISNISTSLATQAGEFFSILFASAIGLMFLLGLILQQRSLKMFRTQFENLTRALSESGFGSAPVEAIKPQAQSSTASPSTTKTSEPFLDFPDESLLEVLGDSYWCSEDQYAHWIWKNISSQQKRMLLEKLEYARDYASYFLTLEPEYASHHEHPYYLAPLPLCYTSQESLGLEVQKNSGLWHVVSPLRQQDLRIPLSDKLQIVQKKPKTAADWKFNQKSPFRSFESAASWGEISVDDEIKILQKPDLVPKKWKKNMQSLVWLSQRDSAYIQNTLAQFDARALATAWVGAPEILSILEAQLPEKKLKLLQTYREKISGSKSSPCFQALVSAGLMDEAA